MKAVLALVLLGLTALVSGGAIGIGHPFDYNYNYPLPAVAPLAYHAPLATIPYAYSTHAYNTVGNYQLKLDTSLPGSAYASYPYAAAPTAYGYGVTKLVK